MAIGWSRSGAFQIIEQISDIYTAENTIGVNITGGKNYSRGRTIAANRRKRSTLEVIDHKNNIKPISSAIIVGIAWNIPTFRRGDNHGKRGGCRKIATATVMETGTMNREGINTGI